MMFSSTTFISIFLIFCVLAAYNDALWIRICALLCGLGAMYCAITKKKRQEKLRAKKLAAAQAAIDQYRKERAEAKAAEEASGNVSEKKD